MTHLCVFYAALIISLYNLHEICIQIIIMQFSLKGLLRLWNWWLISTYSHSWINYSFIKTTIESYYLCTRQWKTVCSSWLCLFFVTSRRWLKMRYNYWRNARHFFFFHFYKTILFLVFNKLQRVSTEKKSRKYNILSFTLRFLSTRQTTHQLNVMFKEIPNCFSRKKAFLNSWNFRKQTLARRHMVL